MDWTLFFSVLCIIIGTLAWQYIYSFLKHSHQMKVISCLQNLCEAAFDCECLAVKIELNGQTYYTVRISSTEKIIKFDRATAKGLLDKTSSIYELLKEIKALPQSDSWN